MSSTYGEAVKISIFGQSHSEAIGVVIDGLPYGEEIDLDTVQTFMGRRAPGQSQYTTSRKEGDVPRIVSGIYEGKTTGAPLCAVIENTNTKSKDYDQLKDIPRPGHADFTAEVKYKGFQDHRGGGHFSGRLTAPLCFAGAVCKQILERKNIYIGGHIDSIHTIQDESFPPVNLKKEDFQKVLLHDFPTIDEAVGEKMKERILKAKTDHDSVGGVVECGVIGLPVGVGEPMFDGLESKLSSIVFGIPAVKGVTFGDGFEVSTKYGSENNDSFFMGADNKVETKTNHHGGSLGGISSGMPLLMKVAFKPTPSIAKEQQSVSLKEGKDTPLGIVGRHDPCIVGRALPCVEAAVAVALLDLYTIYQSRI
ncbi:MAG: chorismate synthase [Bacillota bacterium]